MSPEHAKPAPDGFTADSLDGADAAELAALAGQATDEQLGEAMAHAETRKKVLDEIFDRMAHHVEPSAIADLDAVIHFVITDAPGGGDDGGADVYEAVFKDGEVKVNNPATSESPKVTITAEPVPFLKLVTGQESGPAMFLSGKLKVSGDLLFASRMTSFFSIPSAA